MAQSDLFPYWHLSVDHAHDFCLAAFSTLPLFGLAYLIQNRDQLITLEGSVSRHGARSKTPEETRAWAGELGHLVVFFAAFSIATTLAAISVLLRPAAGLLAAVVLTYSLTAFLLFSRVGSLIAMALMDLLPQSAASDDICAPPLSWRERYQKHPLFSVVILPGPILIDLARLACKNDTAPLKPGESPSKPRESYRVGLAAFVLVLLWVLVVVFALFMLWVAVQMLWRTSVL